MTNVPRDIIFIVVHHLDIHQLLQKGIHSAHRYAAAAELTIVAEPLAAETISSLIF